MSTGVPVHHQTCSVYLFLFGITSTINFQLIYWGTYTQIYQKIKLPVYLHASLLSNYKDLPVTTTTCVHAHRSTRSLPYLFILIISFWQTICTWYLKISSGSEMFNNCYNYNNNNYSAECTCEEQKSYKDVWMYEREKYCNDGWIFLNKSPTMMCLAKKRKEKRIVPCLDEGWL